MYMARSFTLHVCQFCLTKGAKALSLSTSATSTHQQVARVGHLAPLHCPAVPTCYAGACPPPSCAVLLCCDVLYRACRHHHTGCGRPLRACGAADWAVPRRVPRGEEPGAGGIRAKPLQQSHPMFVEMYMDGRQKCPKGRGGPAGFRWPQGHGTSVAGQVDLHTVAVEPGAAVCRAHTGSGPSLPTSRTNQRPLA